MDAVSRDSSAGRFPDLEPHITHHCHTLKNEWVPCGVLLGSVWPEIGGLMRAGAKGRHPRS